MISTFRPSTTLREFMKPIKKTSFVKYQVYYLISFDCGKKNDQIYDTLYTIVQKCIIMI